MSLFPGDCCPVGYGFWAWTQHEGIARFIWAVVLVVGAATIWGTFAVPDDPSRSGKAAVPMPGWLRLFLDLLIFSGCLLAFIASGFPVAGLTLTMLVIIHYAISYDRIAWLLHH